PLRVAVHPMTLTHATDLLVHVDRGEAEVQQETECSLQFGSIDHLDVAVSAALEGRWEVEGAGIAQRTELGRDPEGNRTVRLKLASELSRMARFKFRYRVPLGAALAPE